MKKIIITGASGLVATELICQLLQGGEYELWAVSLHPDVVAKRFNGAAIHCITLEELSSFSEVKFDALVHCAFARSSEPEQLVDSLNYTGTLLQIVRTLKLGLFINISSQSVYGKKYPPFWKEELKPSPDYPYALAKFSTEVLVSTVLAEASCAYTNIRLSSVCENARFLNVFVKNAVSGKAITVMGGNQKISFIDVRDAARALKAVIDKGGKYNIKPLYNLGTGRQRKISELAQDVRRLVQKKLNVECPINFVSGEEALDVGMNADSFCEDFNWAPKFDYDAMICSLIELYDSTGGIPLAYKLIYLNCTFMENEK